MADKQLPKPRTLTPEKAKEVRAKRPQLLAEIDKLLADYPPSYGPIGMRKERA